MKPLILIVEDELIIALDIKEILEEQGYECIMNMASVEEAIQIIDIKNPALVLIDINLKKDKDGIHLGQYLLNKDNIPFVYVTSNSDMSTLERANETRPYGFIVKPFKPIDLIATVSVVLNNNKHRNIDVVRNQIPIHNDAPFILKKVVKYIDDNVSEKIMIPDLIQLSRWKSQHFQKMFTEYMGITPHKYIVDKKMERAKTMLAQSGIPIIQISYDLGFKSHSNFCSLFKKKVGKTPESYRKQEEASKYL